ncbi:hypothetical protein AGMMS49982_14300 [Bacteroidia bacterium]|nr:hypothetical protein AGMMS49982_14300 [Bacteroidia bacterium]
MKNKRILVLGFALWGMVSCTAQAKEVQTDGVNDIKGDVQIAVYKGIACLTRNLLTTSNN